MIRLREWVLRWAYRVYSLQWRMTGAVKIGVRVLLLRDETVLLVRHSYLPGWLPPGGGVKKRETLEQAARREAHEEVGATITGAVELIGIYDNFAEGKSDHVALFVAHDFTLDEFAHTWEIAEKRFIPLNALPKDARLGLGSHIADYLAGKRGATGAW